MSEIACKAEDKASEFIHTAICVVESWKYAIFKGVTVSSTLFFFTSSFQHIYIYDAKCDYFAFICLFRVSQHIPSTLPSSLSSHFFGAYVRRHVC